MPESSENVTPPESPACKAAKVKYKKQRDKAATAEKDWKQAASDNKPMDEVNLLMVTFRREKRKARVLHDNWTGICGQG